MTTFSGVTFQNLKVSPFQITRLVELKLTKQINDHARLYFKAVIPEELKDSYIDKTKVNTKVEVHQFDEERNSQPIFNGIVQTIEVKMVRDIYYLEVKAISHTYNLDIKRKSRSFQKISMSYSELLSQVLTDYPDVDVIDVASNGASLGKVTVQYYETDWAFLKRMASRFFTGLVPAFIFDKPKFYFGVPLGEGKGKLEDYHYSVKKNISHYRYTYENYNQNMDERDVLYYEIETEKVMYIGNKIDYQGKPLYVCQSYTELKDGILKHLYTLCPQKGLCQNSIYNYGLTGISLQGKIIDVEKDNVKVHLDIDKTQSKPDAYWFPYSSVYTAEGNSGWYCMPELDDYVRVYFPTHKEEDSIALSSVRKDSNEGETNKLSDPNIKYFRTAAGKELMLSPQEILITAKDGEVYIRLNDSNGIEIFSKKEIKIISEEDVSVDSKKKVLISAEEEINLTCKGSNIKLVDDSIKVDGNDVKNN